MCNLARERGVVVLLTLLVVLGIGIWVLTSKASRGVPAQLRAEQYTMNALAEAKQALIGRAVADDDRPGSLPCPDAVTNVAGNVPDDGIADVIPGGSSDCPSYTGRLPWRTLGLRDLRDDSGERLWYALSPKFRDHVTAEPINSDTAANDRLVHRESTANTLVPEAVAIIFAAGSALGTQLRDGVLASCAAPNGTIARRLCAANYLDATGGANNSSASGPYIAAQRNASFNDKLLILTAAELMPLVEQRVASELRTALIEYRLESSCKCYPWAATVLGTSTLGQHRGHVPSALALPENWGSGSIPPLQPWFDANRWGEVIYYSVGKTSLQGSGALCTLCTDPSLSVDKIPGYSSVIFTPGAAPMGTSRTPSNWAQYLEDPENVVTLISGNDLYVTPTSTAMARDRLFFTPSAVPAQCPVNGSMLADNAPCQTKNTKGKGKKKKGIKPICQLAKENIENTPCSPVCVSAAAELTKKPCSTKLRKAQCQAALAQLKACTP